MLAGLTGSRVLLMIRDKIANDIPSLCREFGLSDAPHYIEIQIRSLKRVGLIVETDNGNYEVSKDWADIQTALDFSLKQVADLGPNSMVVKPYFGPPDRLTLPSDLFVMMPFQDSLKPVWEDHIKNVARNLGLTARRGDDLFNTHSIMSDVWTAICYSKAIIADCTGRNPNVFYEIGLAHVIGKPVVLINVSYG